MFSGMTPPDFSPLRSGITWFNPQAKPLFERALWRGKLYRLSRRLFRHSWRLPLLGDSVSADMIYQQQAGTIQAVPLDAIRGSVNRCDDFDRRFFPLDRRLQCRWVRVASMMLQQTALPPVEIIRVQRWYFVVDGHHRISVSRMLRLPTVDAIICGAYD